MFPYFKSFRLWFKIEIVGYWIWMQHTCELRSYTTWTPKGITVGQYSRFIPRICSMYDNYQGMLLFRPFRRWLGCWKWHATNPLVYQQLFIRFFSFQVFDIWSGQTRNTFRGHYENVNCCWFSIQDQVRWYLSQF